MVCPINLQINRLIGHHHGLVAFEIRIGPFAQSGHALIQTILVSGLKLEDALSA